MRPLSSQFRPYAWQPSTAEVAARAGIRPEEVLRYDGNTPKEGPAVARPETLAAALASIQSYRHGGFPQLLEAIAEYGGVEPENVVLGAGADDLLMLCVRSYAGAGDRVAIAHEPTYPLYRVAVWVTGADVGEESPVLTIVCRPHNPTGALVDVPAARPLVVDEAYYEYGGDSATDLLDDGVVVVRTFSKAFGLASARVGYALADRETARELNERQSPAPVSTLSAALALAALRDGPPDVSATIEERNRLAADLAAIGLPPHESHTNFLYVETPRADELHDGLLDRGLMVRRSPGAIRITVRDRPDDDRLVEELSRLLVP